jgi:glycosyltransferase involved in cell wall biosynthesis
LRAAHRVAGRLRRCEARIGAYAPYPAGPRMSAPSASGMHAAISVIIITKNEAHDIGECIASVRDWVQEIVVLDSGSTDGTPELCRSLGAQVSETDWPGFGLQKQRALEAARGPWVLSLDADERISPALRDEIIQAVAAPASQVYRMPRQSYYCGTLIKHSGWSPDYVVRLLRRDAARFSPDLVHERLIPNPGIAVATLQHPLTHYSFSDFSEVLQKIDSYSNYGAAQGAARGKRSSLRKAVLHGLWSFLRTYVVQRGFLDGKMGLILAISNAEGTYYRYLKLMLLEQARTHTGKAP